MKYGSLMALLLVMVMVVTACAPVVSSPEPAAEPQPTVEPQPTAVPEPAAPTMDIVDTAVSAGSFNTLVTDEAFAAVPAETLEALLADPEALSQVLLYHVLSGQVLAESVSDGLSADTLQGAPVAFTIVDGKPMINDANIIATDVLATNGVIHVIDRVILPPTDEPAAEAPTMDIVDTAVAAGSFNTLVTAVQAAGLVDALKGEGPFTVFAPTDEAFAAVPVTDGLSADTLQGAPVAFSVMDGKAMINDATIVATDVLATNGVIHVIDRVILPPAEAASEDATPAASEEPAMADMDIVDTAAAAGNFTTLLAAAEAAGLVDALRGEGPLTVFAPTDEAFAKLPAGTLESLLADPEALADILLYHVAEGKLTAKNVADRGFIPTLLGRPLAITAMTDGVRVNEANVVAADIEASNGIIHVIDTVLVPAGN